MKTKSQKAAQIISDVFSPLMLPAYMMAISMWLTPLSLLPERSRLIAMAVVVLLTALLPMLVIYLLIHLGKAGDMSLSNRRERFLPYTIGIICYIIAMLYLHRVKAPDWLTLFYLGAAITTLVAMGITLFWKISAHGSAAGGFAAAMIWMSMHGLLIVNPLWPVVSSVVMCGLVGTSRLILNRHTPAQVFAGYALGAASVIMTLWLGVNS